MSNEIKKIEKDQTKSNPITTDKKTDNARAKENIYDLASGMEKYLDSIKRSNRTYEYMNSIGRVSTALGFDSKVTNSIMQLTSHVSAQNERLNYVSQLSKSFEKTGILNIAARDFLMPKFHHSDIPTTKLSGILSAENLIGNKNAEYFKALSMAKSVADLLIPIPVSIRNIVNPPELVRMREVIKKSIEASERLCAFAGTVNFPNIAAMHASVFSPQVNSLLSRTMISSKLVTNLIEQNAELWQKSILGNKNAFQKMNQSWNLANRLSGVLNLPTAQGTLFDTSLAVNFSFELKEIQWPAQLHRFSGVCKLHEVTMDNIKAQISTIVEIFGSWPETPIEIKTVLLGVVNTLRICREIIAELWQLPVSEITRKSSGTPIMDEIIGLQHVFNEMTWTLDDIWRKISRT